MAEGNGSVSGSILGNTFSVNGIKRMSELIAILSLVVMAVLAVVLYTHTQDVKASERERVAEVKQLREEQRENSEKVQEAIKAQTQQQKLQTCIMYLSLSEEQKMKVGFRFGDVCR